MAHANQRAVRDAARGQWALGKEDAVLRELQSRRRKLFVIKEEKVKGFST